METATKLSEVMENLTFDWQEEKDRVIVDCIENLNNSNIFSLDKEYKRDNCSDDEIFYMEELNELMKGKEPLEIISECRDINVNDDYVVSTIYGWKSVDFKHMRDNYIYTGDIARWLERGGEPYNDELKSQIKEEFLQIVKDLLGDEMMEYVDECIIEEEVITEDWEELLNDLCKRKEEEKNKRG